MSEFPHVLSDRFFLPPAPPGIGGGGGGGGGGGAGMAPVVVVLSRPFWQDVWAQLRGS